MNYTNISSNNFTETFQLYYTPILVITGILGNIFTIIILCRTKLRKLSSSYYLIALSFSDSVFLIILISVWLSLIGMDLFNKPGFCELMVYITGVCSFLSVWLVMAFTFERFVAVKYPFLRQSMCTIERAKMSVIFLTVIALVVFSPMLLFSSVIEENEAKICSVDPRWRISANIFNYIDFLVTYLIPVTVITYLNISISRTILNLSNVRKMLTNQNSRIRERGEQKDKKSKSFRNKISQTKLTKMLLVVSTVFLCLNFPSYIMRVLVYLIELNLFKVEDIDIFRKIQHWCLQLFYTNFGINFYLYCISGQNFRSALTGLFYVRRLKRSETTALTESRTLSTSSAASRRRHTMSIYIETPDSRVLRKQLNVVSE